MVTSSKATTAPKKKRLLILSVHPKKSKNVTLNVYESYYSRHDN